jgi:hypothetical protein
MNKVSPLDIRVAVLAYPLVTKEDADLSARFPKPVVANTGDERMISLFQNSPKPRIETARTRIPPILRGCLQKFFGLGYVKASGLNDCKASCIELIQRALQSFNRESFHVSPNCENFCKHPLRKGQFAMIRLIAILKALLERKENSTVLEEILSPRQLLVPKLPHPPFQTVKPPRFFWHPAYTYPKDEYAPSCLIPESKEETPIAIDNSVSICAYARHVLPKQGILRQDHEGFVYLELPDHFITEMYPLIHDQECEAVPLYYVEPSPAHIPVILPHEWAQRKGWGEIKELENHFRFEITTLYSLKPKRWPGVEKVYFFEIKSRELENFREHYLLPSRIRGHQFHVAIACKKAAEKVAAAPRETFRLNVSCFAA